MLTVGTIVGGGFRLVRDKPVAVLVWCLCYMAAMAVMSLAMGRTFGAMASAGKDPAAAMAQMSSTMGTFLLVEFGMMILFVVLFTATQRAVLRPEQSGFAYIRVGMDELKMFALAFVLLILLYVGMLIVGIVGAIIIGVVAVAAGPAAMGVSMIVLFCALIALAIWFEVRVSLMFPLTLMTGNIAIGEGWRLSKGRFWALFGGYLVVGLILLVLWIGVMAATMGPYLAALSRIGSDPLAMQQAMQAQMAEYASITPQSILRLALSGLVGGLGMALIGGAVATAAKELTTDREGMAETFA
ncbi:MAG: hypothetical protein E6G92_02025 [Alphaproteobacteria bacterium]|nr:MAG: hypothetical protein E6G92_02025 [Alphaproteobacteria bacterium]